MKVSVSGTQLCQWWCQRCVNWVELVLRSWKKSLPQSVMVLPYTSAYVTWSSGVRREAAGAAACLTEEEHDSRKAKG